MDRMMQGIETESIVEVTEDNVDEIVKTEGLAPPAGVRRGEQELPGDPFVVFSAFDWAHPSGDEKWQAHDHWAGTVLGNPARFLYYQDAFAIRRDSHRICQTVYDFHTVFGCMNACDYCHAGGTMVIMLDLEEILDHLDPIVRGMPSQRLYKYDVSTDVLYLEPEYGACKLLVEYFGKLGDPYLMIYSKSDKVEPLLDLDHRGRTIACWTFSSDTVSRHIDKRTPTMSRRIEAARKCREAGYPVRFKLKPIVPVKNWQEENRAALEEMFAKAPPDVLTIQTLSYMNYEACKRAFDMSLFDPRFAKIMEESVEDVANIDRKPLPHDARLEIYHWFIDEVRRISRHTPIALCGETMEIWDALEGKIGMSRDNFVCNCGPSSTPDNLLLRPAHGLV